MREILFRGKRIDNGEWVEGFMVICDDRYFILSKTKINCLNPEWLKKGEYAFCCFIEVDPETVGQYTRLTDKNGKKIFEGDIVRYMNKETMVVVWNNDSASFVIAYSAINFNYLATISSAHIYLEVIGNIHDNPELMEESV